MVVPVWVYMGLDAVEIIWGWENAFDIKLSDEEVCELRTPQQAIDLIAIKVDASDRVSGVCLGLRAYHRIRQAFCSVLKVHRSQVRLDSNLRELLPKKQRQDVWQKIFTRAGFSELPPFGFGVGLVFTPIIIKDIVIWSVACHPRNLVNSNEQWTHSQVRSVVRAVIIRILGTEQFSDNDDFVEDLGIN
jgi:hypothetical protein